VTKPKPNPVRVQKPAWEPSPAEILAKCEEIQKEWGAYERKRRERTSGREAWQVKVYRIDGRITGGGE
jgi:hypothetical protein